jgi:hypothetical protein
MRDFQASFTAQVMDVKRRNGEDPQTPLRHIYDPIHHWFGLIFPCFTPTAFWECLLTYPVVYANWETFPEQCVRIRRTCQEGIFTKWGAIFYHMNNDPTLDIVTRILGLPEERSLRRLLVFQRRYFQGDFFLRFGVLDCYNCHDIPTCIELTSLIGIRLHYDPNLQRLWVVVIDLTYSSMQYSFFLPVPGGGGPVGPPGQLALPFCEPEDGEPDVP